MAVKEKKEPKEKKEKVERIPFAMSDDARESGLLNDEGRLTTHEFGSIIDSKLHKAPKKTDFADEHIYLFWKADKLEVTAEAYVKRATACRRDAEVIMKQPDPEKRSAIRRLARLRDQAAALELELAAEGIEVD